MNSTIGRRARESSKTQGPRYLLLATMAMAMLASPAAHALELVSLQLKWHHQFQFAGYYAALEKGFYRDAGLEVEIREGGPNVNAIEDVVSGRANFGVGTSGALIARARGQQVVVLAAIFQHSPAILLVPRDAGIASVFALQGRSLMDTPGSEDIAAMLKLAGVDYAQMPRVKHNGDPRDLVSGKADAMVAYSSSMTFRASKSSSLSSDSRWASFGTLPHFQHGQHAGLFEALRKNVTSYDFDAALAEFQTIKAAIETGE